MGYYHLTIELIIDILAVCLGISLIIKPSDNLPKFYWGVIAASIGLMFTWENVGWLLVRNADPLYEYTDILNIEKMLKWFALASIISLYPLASLRPGLLNRFRLLLYLLPTLIITTIGICYMAFNGNITEISSIDQVYINIDQFDIQLRLTIFAFTVIIPLLYFICPVIKQKTYRRITSMMYIFIGFLFLLLAIYMLHPLY
ncbi:MAG: hypothetical protein LUE93_08885 [Bacteroides sp.]|nr:hypothetical protein [Bacteroides sp.]